ncbi:hypothetical protein THAOC_13455, partial [Thalassiosira oceanica]
EAADPHRTASGSLLRLPYKAQLLTPPPPARGRGRRGDIRAVAQPRVFLAMASAALAVSLSNATADRSSVDTATSV